MLQSVSGWSGPSFACRTASVSAELERLRLPTQDGVGVGEVTHAVQRVGWSRPRMAVYRVRVIYMGSAIA